MRRKLKLLVVFMLCVTVVAAPVQRSQAAVPLAILEIIKAGVKKVIKAVDLKIQRMQNKTIWLQNAQKVLENALSKLKLEEISGWVEKQHKQYSQYYEELRKVKQIIIYYQRIRDIADKQSKIVALYGNSWRTVQQDDHFSPEEIKYMGSVYLGILEETLKNVEQLGLVVNSFKTQMSDGERLEMIDDISKEVDRNYSDLRAFNAQNGMLSRQRAASLQEIELVKKLYGID